MSPDNVDNMIVRLVAWIENEVDDSDYFNDDARFERFSEFVHGFMEPFITKDRNYN